MSVTPEHVGLSDTYENIAEMNESTSAARLNGEGLGHCGQGALTNPFGIFIQGILAFVAFSTLMLKRLREPKGERRPWRIWFYDTSKQALGALVIHFANVFLADIFQGDPCTWYIINFLLDSTVGLLIIYIGLTITQVIVKRKRCDSLRFGEYGDPPSCNSWMGQCGLYILVVIIEKILITLLVQFQFWDQVRDFILSPIHNPELEVAIVMLIIPFIVNAIMFWVVDNFLMRKTRRHKEPKAGQACSKVKYHRKDPEKNSDNGSESEVLLSPDEEMDKYASGDDAKNSLIPTSNSISM
ncbi:store-operated calcium entry regulator STIMATE-like [Ptychodera flava]|uniref:store-operated calcium entry regulator STIMATE-like n=1 Tax=Ptychodera flava TaxID=63121 RepID=UPI003969FE68